MFYFNYLRSVAITLILILFMSHDAAALQNDDGWRFSISPYVWAPGVDGTMAFEIPPGDAGSPNVENEPINYLEILDFALMLSGGAQKGKWFVFVDFINADFSSEKSKVKSINLIDSDMPSHELPPLEIGADLDAGTYISLEAIQSAFAGGYRLAQSNYATVDLFGGCRYLNVHATVNWQLKAAIYSPLGEKIFEESGTMSQREILWDGIAGLRGQIHLGDTSWFFPYYMDFGSGSAKFTWQGMLGVAYAFKWGDIKLAYRHLYYDTKTDKLLDDISFSGYGLGATFRF